MSEIVLYDSADPTVAHRVTAYYPSAHTPDYDGESEKLVNPDLSAVSAVSQRYWKHSAGSVVEMSQGEKDLMDAVPAPKNVVKSDDQSSVASTTYQSKALLTTESLGRGNYAIHWYAEVQMKERATLGVRVILDGATVLAETSIQDVSQWHPIPGFEVLELAAGVHTVDIQFKSSSNTIAVYIRNARVKLAQVE